MRPRRAPDIGGGPGTGHGQLRINASRIAEQLEGLARFGAISATGVNRPAYGDADLEARGYITQLMRAAGLDPRIDAAGNTVAWRKGSGAGLKPITIGSHTDSVPEGGRYDGSLGTLGAIEVARTIHEHDIDLAHALEVYNFQNEEGGLVGSRAVAGTLPAAELDRISHSGKSLREGITFLGGDAERWASARRKPGDIAAFVELHIEQGGVLEREHLDIGVVEGMVGIYWWEVTVTGAANHAGTTPMDQRQDALLAAAMFIQQVHRTVTGMAGRQVGTVGRIEALPGAANEIAGHVSMSLELRDLDDAKVAQVFERLKRGVRHIEHQTGTCFAFKQTSVNEPAPTDPRVRRAISTAAESLGLRAKSMPSGAGHDAQNMARLGPAGMIFIPSVGGVSHSPKEYSRPEDIVNGINVLLHTVLELDKELT